MTDGSSLVDLDPPAPAASNEGRFLPWLWVVVGALLIAGVVSAFVVDGEPTGAERIAAAAASVEEAGTFAYTLSIESRGPLALTVTTEGLIDARTGASTATIESNGTTIEMVTDDGALYVKVPDAARDAFGGKPWARLDTDALTSGFGGVAPSSPLQTFEQLRDAGEVDEVAKERVRGVETTRFRTVVDLSSSLPAGLVDAKVRKALEAVEVEVWLDDDDRVRRHRTSLELALVAGSTIDLITTIETFDFGTPVNVVVPPADQVADAGPGGLGSLFAPAPALAPPAPAD